MELSNLTLIVTDDCNFNCPYCFQKKEEKYIDVFTAKNAVDFFFPFLKQSCDINFYGGEPLLAFEQIREIFNYIQDKNKNFKKQIQCSITSNGSLINDDILQFLNQNKFFLLLSFDGLAQDVSRKKGSFAPIVSILERLIGCADIELETNSVFTADTVGYLSRSIRFIIESGVPTANISFSNLPPWSESALVLLKKELSELQEFILSFYRETGAIPVANFRKNLSENVFACYAGKDRIALSPDGSLWGCCFFYDYFKGKEKSKEFLKYCFGSLESFMENHERIYPEILKNYSNLRMEYFFTSNKFCMLCEKMTDCVVCPIDAAFGSSVIGKIPGWVCRLRKVMREEKLNFLEDLESLSHS
ncbi:MAG: radical SAM protein [Candidatus Aminicenantaceae bacterium]